MTHPRPPLSIFDPAPAEHRNTAPLAFEAIAQHMQDILDEGDVIDALLLLCQGDQQGEGDVDG